MSKYCEACDRLKKDNSHFVLNGITDEECNALMDDKGLNDKLDPLHTDCDDLNDMNDCLIGELSERIDGYDDCDWKRFAKDQMKNLWNLFKATTCAICGIWKKIHELEQNQFQMTACQEVGSGIFKGTAYSGSYMKDPKGNKTLLNYQLRIQITPTSTITLAPNEALEIEFEGKSWDDEKLPCMDQIMEHVEKVCWHNAALQGEKDIPKILTKECYVFSPGKNIAGRAYHGNIVIIAGEEGMEFPGGEPWQTALTWAAEPNVVTPAK